jgi:N-hydroxyarylamine O-acetyltransferase
MDIRKYLERIEYYEPIAPTLEVLSKLQSSHLMTVPFENLDIHNHIKIDLDHLFDKIVTRKRGGFCYELNGLFYELLHEIGFIVKMVSARVHDGKGDYSPEFDHMALIVNIENGHYLVDVGFGEFSFYPLKIEMNKEINDPRGIFKIEILDEQYRIVKKKNAEGIFIPEYIFSERERKMEEFLERCDYHQTSPESHFKQKRICSLPTKEGRISLSEDVLKTTIKGEITEKKLKGEQEVQEQLWKYFKITL